jgi:hypothetical protein
MLSAISVSTLKDIIEKSTMNKTILIPSRDYYARPGDTDQYNLDYICPHTLLTCLESLDTFENGVDVV